MSTLHMDVVYSSLPSSCPCALLEVAVLTLLLLVASSAGVFFAVGVEGSLSTLKDLIRG